jgi:hypothetical protein
VGPSLGDLGGLVGGRAIRQGDWNRAFRGPRLEALCRIPDYAELLDLSCAGMFLFEELTKVWS